MAREKGEKGQKGGEKGEKGKGKEKGSGKPQAKALATAEAAALLDPVTGAALSSLMGRTALQDYIRRVSCKSLRILPQSMSRSDSGQTRGKGASLRTARISSRFLPAPTLTPPRRIGPIVFTQQALELHLLRQQNSLIRGWVGWEGGGCFNPQQNWPDEQDSHVRRTQMLELQFCSNLVQQAREEWIQRQGPTIIEECLVYLDEITTWCETKQQSVAGRLSPYLALVPTRQSPGPDDLTREE